MVNGDSELKSQLKASGVEDLTEPEDFFLVSGEAAKAYLGSDNFWRVTIYFEDGTQKTFKFENATSRQSAQMMEVKLVAQNTVHIRDLAQAESLYVIRLCHKGNIADALANYVFFRCGEIDHDPTDDPHYLPVLNSAAWFCFEHLTPAFSEAARGFMQQYLANRKVINLPILTAAFKAYEIEQARSNRSLLPRSFQPDAQSSDEIDLESLSDEEIQQLKAASLLEHARQNRR